MRLLVVTNDYPPKPGGIQQWLGNLVDAFPGEVRVLAPADGPATNRRGEDVVVRGPHRFLLPTRPVRRWVDTNVREFQPDVVLYGAPHPLTLVARRVRDVTGVPYVVMTHGAEITIPAAVPGLRRLLARPLAAADGLFAVSDFTGARVSALAGAPVVTLGAGVDVDTFRPGQGDGPSDGPLVVGCVSRFVPRKGQHRLLRAAGKLNRRGTPVRVMLVGRGRKERFLRALARRLDVDVEFLVDVPWASLPGLYRRMDVFAMPCKSRWFGLEVEGLGIVYLEAAASGIPVIAGDSGGAPETVVPDETGFVAGTQSDLIRAIESVADDRRLGERLGRSGRDMVLRDWTWQRVAGRLVEGLQDVV